MTAARIVLDAGTKGSRIDPDIYGHFAEHLGRCVHEGVWVGEKSRIPNVRGIRKGVIAVRVYDGKRGGGMKSGLGTIEFDYWPPVGR
ncbi:MAG: hypothetical protein AAB152_03755 [Candidatus Coatesbacteria bacterium]